MDIESILRKAFEKRKGLMHDPATDCFRLFNSDGDGIAGLTIDRYGEYLLIQYFGKSLHDETDSIIGAIKKSADLLPVRPGGVLLKTRVKPSDERDISAAMKSTLLDGSWPPADFHVRQNGLLAAVDLVGGQSTGIFLDMREVRDRLARYYRPSDIMLNLFSYTALFSVHAVSRGITGAVNVDLSRGVLERAKVNYALNGLKIDDRDFVYGDSLDWLRRFKKQGRRFSFVVFDPPTFSRNRRRTFSLKKNYRQSLDLVDGLVGEGYALTTVNSYSVSREQYLSFHPAGWKLEFFANESSDFTVSGKPYLKVGLWAIKNS